MNDDYIDELFARKLGNMEVTPPEDGWCRIKDELNRRASMARVRWIAAASIAVVLSVTASVFYLQTQLDTTDVVAETIFQQPEELLPIYLEELPPIINNVIISPTPVVVSAVFIDEAPTPEILTELVYEKTIDIPAYIDLWVPLAMEMEMPSNVNNPVDNIVAATTFMPDFQFMDFAPSSRSRTRWEISGQFAPMHSYRAISSMPSDLRRSDFYEAENPLLVYSGGISLSYRAFGRFSIQTGIFYSQMGQLISGLTHAPNRHVATGSNNEHPIYFVRTSSGSVSLASNLKSSTNTTYSSYFNAESHLATEANIHRLTQFHLIERYDYLEIPLIVRYKIVDRKLSFHVLSGMSANVLLGTNSFIDNGSEIVRDGTVLSARPVSYSSVFGVGIGYQIIRNLSFGIEPTFKYFLQPYTTSSQIITNPYALGIYAGVTYRF